MSFKRQDIQKCACCGKGLAQGGVHFYRVHIEQMVLDHAAIQRESGLEAVMGGNVAIAAALSPNEDLAQVFRSREVLICGECGVAPQVPAVLLEDDGGYS